MQGKCQEVDFALLSQNCFCERRDDDYASGRGIVKLIYPVERGYVLDVFWQIIAVIHQKRADYCKLNNETNKCACLPHLLNSHLVEWPRRSIPA